jgi:hypothetical protein
LYICKRMTLVSKVYFSHSGDNKITKKLIISNVCHFAFYMHQLQRIFAKNYYCIVTIVENGFFRSVPVLPQDCADRKNAPQHQHFQLFY